MIVDADNPNKFKGLGTLHFKLNDKDNYVVDGEVVAPIAKIKQGTYVWHDPAGFDLWANSAGELYIPTANLRQIPHSAPAEIFNIEDSQGRQLFLRRTQQGFEVIDPTRGTPQVIYTENIDFNNVAQYRAFTERLTRVWRR